MTRRSQLLAGTNLTVRADEAEPEDKDKKADEALKTMIMDAVADAVKPSMDAAERCMDAAEKVMDRMDRMDARMDALGARPEETETEEDRRRDAEVAEELRAKGEPEETAADKQKRRDAERSDRARRDAEEKEAVEAKEREDKARKDAEAKAKEESETHADADMTVLRQQVADLTARLGRQEAITPIPVTDEQGHAMLERQARADEVYGQLGERAPPPLVNESLPTYRRRLLRGLAKYSDSLKETRWDAVNDDVALNALETRVYADAVTHAHNPASVPAGHLVALTERTPTGHTITRYRGDASAWMLPMAGAVTQYVTGFEGV
jgi:hypothetical protein